MLFLCGLVQCCVACQIRDGEWAVVGSTRCHPTQELSTHRYAKPCAPKCNSASGARSMCNVHACCYFGLAQCCVAGVHAAGSKQAGGLGSCPKQHPQPSPMWGLLCRLRSTQHNTQVPLRWGVEECSVLNADPGANPKLIPPHPRSFKNIRNDRDRSFFN